MPGPLTADDIWAQLDRLATEQEGPIRLAYRAAIARLRESITDAEIQTIVRTGDFRPLLDKLDLTNVKLATRRAILQSAIDQPDPPFGVHFDAINPWAVRAMTTYELQLTQGLTTDVVAGVQRLLTWGIQQGVNPVETARLFRPTIGLDARGAQSLVNYEALLTGGAKGQPFREALRRATRDRRFDRSIIRAIDDKSPLKPAQLQNALRRFEELSIKARAETIARTNTMDALYQSQMMRWQQAIEAGRVASGALRRFWYTARDEEVCPVCSAVPGLNPLGVGFYEPFQLPNGATLMGPTAHPNCRCVVFIKFAIEKAFWRQLAQTYSGLRSAA